jgi:hypothetical protein
MRTCCKNLFGFINTNVKISFWEELFTLSRFEDCKDELQCYWIDSYSSQTYHCKSTPPILQNQVLA